MGANLPSRTPGVDHDVFDPYCDHLVVRDTQSGEVVGTYRILSPENARQVGYYSENEFDLTRLQHLRSRLVEIGRSCVHPDYRTGATITLLWSGLAQYMTERGYDYLMGCASISMADGGHAAASLYNRLSEDHLGPLEYRVFPRCPLPLAALQQDRPAETPPLIKGYLRAGHGSAVNRLGILISIPPICPSCCRWRKCQTVTPNTIWNKKTAYQ